MKIIKNLIFLILFIRTISCESLESSNGLNKQKKTIPIEQSKVKLKSSDSELKITQAVKIQHTNQDKISFKDNQKEGANEIKKAKKTKNKTKDRESKEKATQEPNTKKEGESTLEKSQKMTENEIQSKIQEEQKVIGNNEALLSNLLSKTLNGKKGPMENNPASILDNLNKNPLRIDNLISNELQNLSSKMTISSPSMSVSQQLQSKLNQLTTNPSKLVSSLPKQKPKTIKKDEKPDPPFDPSKMQIPGPSPQSLLAMANPIEINKERAKNAPDDLKMTINDFQSQISSGMIGPGFMRNQNFGSQTGEMPSFPSFGSSHGFGAPALPVGPPRPSSSPKKQSNPEKKNKGSSALQSGFGFGENLFSGLFDNKSAGLDPQENMKLPSGIPVLSDPDSFKRFFGESN